MVSNFLLIEAIKEKKTSNCDRKSRIQCSGKRTAPRMRWRVEPVDFCPRQRRQTVKEQPPIASRVYASSSSLSWCFLRNKRCALYAGNELQGNRFISSEASGSVKGIVGQWASLDEHSLEFRIKNPAAEMQVLRLRRSQKTRPTPLRMTALMMRS